MHAPRKTLRQRTQNFLNRRSDIGVEMHRIQNFYVGRLIQYIDQGVADVPEGRAETLPAMPGDEDETLSRTQETKMRLQPVAQCRVLVQAVDNP